MGKSKFNSAFQKTVPIDTSILLLASILIFAVSWAGCGGDGTDEEGSVTFSLRVVGEEEVVFDWSTDRCEDGDIPDLPARAFRDDSGQVQLIASAGGARRFIGPDLDSLKHECEIVMESEGDPNPANFNYGEWIAATYTEDGKTIYALIHNEYYGEDGSDPYNYNSVTLAVSTDSGASYHHPVTPPAHLVACYPIKYEPGLGQTGIYMPTNIIKDKDGFYYSFVLSIEPFGEGGVICLMRTDDLSDPKSWRFWDGNGFEGTFINPYTDENDDPEAHVCTPVENADIDSLTYNKYINRYVNIRFGGISGDDEGVYYSLSEDLIHWSPGVLFYHLQTPWEPDYPGQTVYQYASLIDPESDSRNFETAGKTAYLYYTRLNQNEGDLDRDLVRVKVEFLRSDKSE